MYEQIARTCVCVFVCVEISLCVVLASTELLTSLNLYTASCETQYCVAVLSILRSTINFRNVFVEQAANSFLEEGKRSLSATLKLMLVTVMHHYVVPGGLHTP